MHYAGADEIHVYSANLLLLLFTYTILKTVSWLPITIFSIPSPPSICAATCQGHVCVTTTWHFTWFFTLQIEPSTSSIRKKQLHLAYGKSTCPQIFHNEAWKIHEDKVDQHVQEHVV